jgi:polyphosphate kinase
MSDQNRLLCRELSLLAFNRRVLAQAQDARVPLLERLRFLCIVSSNLDEFFEVRMAWLKREQKLRPNSRLDNGKTPCRNHRRRVGRSACHYSGTIRAFQ